MRRALFLAVVFVLFAGFVQATSIGAVPSSLDFGEVQQGEEIEQSIYITVRSATSRQNFTVNPSANGISAGTLFSDRFSNEAEISEQSSRDWWSFEEATVGPNITVQADDLDISGLPRLNGVATGTLEIPDDAEPGLRYGYINLNANPPQGAEGAGNVGFVSPTRVRYSFYVQGEPDRSIQVQDVRSFRLDEDRAAIEVLLSNRGTVTTTAQDFEIDVTDSSRSSVASVEANGITLEPGETQWVDATWSDTERIEGGSYEIDGEVDYFTGSAYASGSFSLPDFNVVEVRPDDSPAVDGDERSTVPLWLVFMVLALLGVLMWSFDIEPFWILLIVGGLAVSSFILLSGVSNYLLVVLLMTVGIVMYGVM